jgi:chromosomal replication initiation ATPase DnaA
MRLNVMLGKNRLNHQPSLRNAARQVAVERKASEIELKIPPAALRIIAQFSADNALEIAGDLSRVRTYCDLVKKPIDVDTVVEALGIARR